jgi:imidazole glycerol phosphate synthase glutamine amidotransferase subunit
VTIAVIDYGAGNVPSVERALEKLGVASRRVSQPGDLADTTAVVLPGVGHYAAIIRALDQQKLRAPLIDVIRRGVPFLGICLGLQALYSSSDEAPKLSGLGVLPGSVKSLPHNVKLPHTGWNRLRIQAASVLLEGLSESDYFYFAHTFAAVDCLDATVATCVHGAPFTAALERGRLFATQFHPEKSGAAGARLLHNFLRCAGMRLPA